MANKFWDVIKSAANTVKNAIVGNNNTSAGSSGAGASAAQPAAKPTQNQNTTAGVTSYNSGIQGTREYAQSNKQAFQQQYQLAKKAGVSDSQFYQDYYNGTRWADEANNTSRIRQYNSGIAGTREYAQSNMPEFRTQYDLARKAGVSDKDFYTLYAQGNRWVDDAATQRIVPYDSGTPGTKEYAQEHNDEFQQQYQMAKQAGWNDDEFYSAFAKGTRWRSEEITAPMSVGGEGKEPGILSQASSFVNDSKFWNDMQDRRLKRWQERYGSATFADDFFGQTGANYSVGFLSQELNRVYNDLADNPNDEHDVQYAKQLESLLDSFQTRNASALDDVNAKATWISKHIAAYMPQLQAEIIPAAGAAAIGAGAAAVGLVGLGVVPAAWSAYRYSRVATSAINAYEVTRGAAYNSLIQTGANANVAREAATDEAIISSLIEMHDTAFEMFALIPGIGKAFGKAGAEAATKTISSILKGYLGNVVEEGGEEFLQETLSAANRERILAGDGDNGIGGLISYYGRFLLQMARGEHSDDLAQAMEAAKGGAIIGAVMGGGHLVGGAVQNSINNNRVATVLSRVEENPNGILNIDSNTLEYYLDKAKADGKTHNENAAKIIQQELDLRSKLLGSVTQEKGKAAPTYRFLTNDQRAELKAQLETMTRDDITADKVDLLGLRILHTQCLEAGVDQRIDDMLRDEYANREGIARQQQAEMDAQTQQQAQEAQTQPVEQPVEQQIPVQEQPVAEESVPAQMSVAPAVSESVSEPTEQAATPQQQQPTGFLPQQATPATEENPFDTENKAFDTLDRKKSLRKIVQGYSDQTLQSSLETAISNGDKVYEEIIRAEIAKRERLSERRAKRGEEAASAYDDVFGADTQIEPDEMFPANPALAAENAKEAQRTPMQQTESEQEAVTEEAIENSQEESEAAFSEESKTESEKPVSQEEQESSPPAESTYAQNYDKRLEDHLYSRMKPGEQSDFEKLYGGVTALRENKYEKKRQRKRSFRAFMDAGMPTNQELDISTELNSLLWQTLKSTKPTYAFVDADNVETLLYNSFKVEYRGCTITVKGAVFYASETSDGYRVLRSGGMDVELRDTFTGQKIIGTETWDPVMMTDKDGNQVQATNPKNGKPMFAPGGTSVLYGSYTPNKVTQQKALAYPINDDVEIDGTKAVNVTGFNSTYSDLSDVAALFGRILYLDTTDPKLLNKYLYGQYKSARETVLETVDEGKEPPTEHKVVKGANDTGFEDYYASQTESVWNENEQGSEKAFDSEKAKKRGKGIAYNAERAVHNSIEITRAEQSDYQSRDLYEVDFSNLTDEDVLNLHSYLEWLSRDYGLYQDMSEEPGVDGERLNRLIVPSNDSKNYSMFNGVDEETFWEIVGEVNTEFENRALESDQNLSVPEKDVDGHKVTRGWSSLSKNGPVERVTAATLKDERGNERRIIIEGSDRDTKFVPAESRGKNVPVFVKLLKAFGAKDCFFATGLVDEFYVGAGNKPSKSNLRQKGAIGFNTGYTETGIDGKRSRYGLIVFGNKPGNGLHETAHHLQAMAEFANREQASQLMDDMLTEFARYNLSAAYRTYEIISRQYSDNIDTEVRKFIAKDKTLSEEDVRAYVERKKVAKEFFARVAAGQDIGERGGKYFVPLSEYTAKLVGSSKFKALLALAQQASGASSEDLEILQALYQENAKHGAQGLEDLSNNLIRIQNERRMDNAETALATAGGQRLQQDRQASGRNGNERRNRLVESINGRRSAESGESVEHVRHEQLVSGEVGEETEKELRKSRRAAAEKLYADGRKVAREIGNYLGFKVETPNLDAYIKASREGGLYLENLRQKAMEEYQQLQDWLGPDESDAELHDSVGNKSDAPAHTDSDYTATFGQQDKPIAPEDRWMNDAPRDVTAEERAEAAAQDYEQREQRAHDVAEERRDRIKFEYHTPETAWAIFNTAMDISEKKFDFDETNDVDHADPELRQRIKAMDSLREAAKAVGEGRMSTNEFAKFILNAQRDQHLGQYINENTEAQLLSAMQNVVDAYDDASETSSPAAANRYAHESERAVKMLSKRMERWDTADRLKQTLRAETLKTVGGNKRLSRRKARLNQSGETLGDTATTFLGRMQINPTNVMRGLIAGFNKYGGTEGYRIAEEQNRATAVNQTIIANAQMKYLEIRKMKGFKKFAEMKDTKKVSLLGTELNLSQQQIVALYKTVRTLAADYRANVGEMVILDSKGNEQRLNADGNLKHDAKGNVTGERSITHEDFRDMQRALWSQIDEVGMKYLEATDETLDDLGKQNADVEERVNGYTPRTYKKGDYMPVRYLPKGKSVRSADDTYKFGAAYERTRKAGGTVLVEPVTTVVDRYINQSANHIAYAELGDQFALMNRADSSNQSLSEIMKENYGEQMRQWMDVYVRDLNNTNPKDNEDGLSTMLRKGRQAVQTGALVGSVSVPMKQISSYWAAAGRLRMSTLRKAYRIKFVGAKNTSEGNALAYYRKVGGIDPTISEIMKSDGLWAKMRNKSKILQMMEKSIPLMDYRTIDNLYTACCIEVKEDNPRLDVKSEKYQQLVNELFEDVVISTQPIFTRNARAEYARTNSEFIKLFSMFRTQQTQNLNNIFQAIGEARAAKGTVGEFMANEQLGETIKGQAASALSLALLTVVADVVLHKHRKYKDEDDEVDPEKVLNRIGLNAIEGAAGTMWFADSVLKFAIDKINAAHGKSSSEFYGVNMGIVSTIGNIMDSISNLIESPNLSNLQYTAGYMAQAFGIPLSNAYRAINASIMWARDIRGENDGAYDDILRYLENEVVVTPAATAKTKAHILINAELKGNEEKANRLYDQLAGDKNRKTNIRSDLKNRYMSGKITEDQGVDLLLRYGEMDLESAQKRNNLWEFLKDNPKYQDSDKYNISESFVEKYNTLAQPAGIPANSFYEYMQRANNTHSIDVDGDGNANGKGDITKQAQIIEYINGLNLSSEQKDALWIAFGYKTTSKAYKNRPWK